MRADHATAEADAAVWVGEIKQQLKTLKARDAELVEAQIRIERERAEVAAAVEQAEAELEAAVAAPVAGGEDPTLWLPDELMVLILVHVLVLDDCNAVCRRWRRLCQDRTVQDGSWETRWELYAAGKRQPRSIRCASRIASLCVGDGKVYCGTTDGSIDVRSDKDGSLLHTFTGHSGEVDSLALGPDETLYSASSAYNTIRVFSGITGAQLQTMEGHTSCVNALAINEINVFSGSRDGIICVWQCSTGNLVRTLHTYGGEIWSLALGIHNQLYSVSARAGIQVWSITDYTVLHTTNEHCVWTMTVGKDGTVFVVGGRDPNIRVWSGIGGALRTVESPIPIRSLAITPTGALISVSSDSTISVWRRCGRSRLAVVPPSSAFSDPIVAVSHNGHVWVSHGDLLNVY